MDENIKMPLWKVMLLYAYTKDKKYSKLIEKAFEKALEDDERKEITFQALLKAKEAFVKYLKEEGYEPAYWKTDFKAIILTTNFTPLRTIELTDER